MFQSCLGKLLPDSEPQSPHLYYRSRTFPDSLGPQQGLEMDCK